jgi:ribosomal protein S18 acetylase RimI-like enzyme
MGQDEPRGYHRGPSRQEVALSITVALRAATAEDDAFLRRLYLDARPEFAALGPGQLDAVVDLQLRAQREQYRHEHPDAQDHVVVVDGVPVGRCWTAESERQLWILALAVLSTSRGRGVATAVLRDVCEHAASSGRTVGLSVWAANEPARRLYERLGFRPGTESGGYLAMLWDAG